jgi:hypothetical protein
MMEPRMTPSRMSSPAMAARAPPMAPPRTAPRMTLSEMVEMAFRTLLTEMAEHISPMLKLPEGSTRLTGSLLA